MAVLNFFGITLRNQKKLDEAMACLRKAIELAPKGALPLNNLACILVTADDIKLRNPAEALELARKAVQLDPKRWEHWNTLSVAGSRQTAEGQTTAERG